MRVKLGLFAIFSLIILMFVPAYADVTKLTLDKDAFTIDDKFTISGTVDDSGRVLLAASMKGPSDEKLNRNAYSSDGKFSFTPVTAENLFDREGTYTITVFTELQSPDDGAIIKLEYDNGIATILPDYELILKPIGSKQIDETKKLSFTASVTDSEIKDEQYRLNNHPSGATIDPNTGVFSWTPTITQSGGYIFDVIVNAGPLEDKETIAVTVIDQKVTTQQPTTPTTQQPTTPTTQQPTTPTTQQPTTPTTQQPTTPTTQQPQDLGIASFVDETKDPQSYVDRYTNEPTYKKWFDDNFAEYDSIYQAVGLEEPLLIPASFVDETKDPQSYVDRYTNEPTYKKWFDDNFAEYDSIYQAVGLDAPTVLAPFVDPNLDPQYYVDRYNKEATYKEWFDETYPDITIYEAVGLEEEEIIESEFGECGKGTDLVDGMCVIVDGSNGGGCLIATATYGSEMAPQVQLLREIRDNQLMSTSSGSSFMTGFNQLYYSFSPTIADMERENPLFKEVIKIGITPLLSSLSIMSHAESESEVLGYGIGVLLLNLGMYVAAPAMIIYKAKKYVRI